MAWIVVAISAAMPSRSAAGPGSAPGVSTSVSSVSETDRPPGQPVSGRTGPGGPDAVRVAVHGHYYHALAEDPGQADPDGRVLTLQLDPG